MFHHRSSAFATNVSAIEGRLRALENEFERIGRTAGRHTSAGISAAGDHVGDVLASAVTEIVDARLKDVVIAVRADEAGHRDVNHGFADQLWQGR